MSVVETEIRPSIEGLAAAAAGFIGQRLRDSAEERGTASLVLTGGTAGIATVGALLNTDVPWHFVHIFFGDERFVPAGDAQRNDYQAEQALLNKITPAAIHRFPARGGRFGTDVAAAAQHMNEYLTDLDISRGFDVHMLGMGGEGHINSIFPGSPAIEQTEKYVMPVTQCPKPPAERITLTLPVVRQAQTVVFTVAGSDKAEAVKLARSGSTPAQQCPAAGAQGVITTAWFLDSAAATLIN